MELLCKNSQKQNMLLIQDYCPNPAMKNEFQTLFFTCKLTKMELAGNELNGYEVDDSAQFLIMHLQIKNITNEILVMYQSDFMIYYDGSGPFRGEENFKYPHQFEDEYALKPQDEIKGSLIFIIAKNSKKIMFNYTEYFEDGSEGKTYKLKYKITS